MCVITETCLGRIHHKPRGQVVFLQTSLLCFYCLVCPISVKFMSRNMYSQTHSCVTFAYLKQKLHVVLLSHSFSVEADWCVVKMCLKGLHEALLCLPSLNSDLWWRYKHSDVQINRLVKNLDKSKSKRRREENR